MSDFAERFEDLRVRQPAHAIANEVYEAFAECRDYRFRDHIQRAFVLSIYNIAEGFERCTAKDFGHFLDIAKGSSGRGP